MDSESKEEYGLVEINPEAQKLGLTNPSIPLLPCTAGAIPPQPPPSVNQPPSLNRDMTSRDNLDKGHSTKTAFGIQYTKLIVPGKEKSCSNGYHLPGTTSSDEESVGSDEEVDNSVIGSLKNIVDDSDNDDEWDEEPPSSDATLLTSIETAAKIVTIETIDHNVALELRGNEIKEESSFETGTVWQQLQDSGLQKLSEMHKQYGAGLSDDELRTQLAERLAQQNEAICLDGPLETLFEEEEEEEEDSTTSSQNEIQLSASMTTVEQGNPTIPSCSQPIPLLVEGNQSESNYSQPQTKNLMSPVIDNKTSTDHQHIPNNVSTFESCEQKGLGSGETSDTTPDSTEASLLRSACTNSAAENWKQISLNQSLLEKQSQTNSEQVHWSVGPQAPFTVKAAIRYFNSGDCNLAKHKAEIRSTVKGRSLWSKLRTTSLKLSLEPERDFVFLLAKEPLDFSIDQHGRMMRTIYTKFTGDDRDCSPSGSHWVTIGFQGTDPRTDLRAVGMFGVLQALNFLEKEFDRSNRVFKVSSRPSPLGFPMMAVSLNLTLLCMNVLREGKLNKYSNVHGSVLTAVNALYIGLWITLEGIWVNECCSIEDFDSILKRLAKLCNNDVPNLLQKSTHTNVPQRNSDQRVIDTFSEIE